MKLRYSRASSLQWALIVGLLIIGAGAAAFFFLRRSEPALDTVPSVAVLPFDNMSADPNLQYFADGTTENLITSLARSPNIKVVARSSSAAFKGKSADVRQVGKELNARYVVEGSVQQSAGTVRIVAQLIDARSGNHVWAQRFDQQGSDPLALQDQITEKIVQTLTGHEGLINKREFEEAWGKDTAELGEYDFYLRGQDLFLRLTKQDTLKALDVWQDGLRKYPHSALLKARLGWGTYQMFYGGWSEDREKQYRQAAQFVREALASNNPPPLAKLDSHWLLAFYYLEYELDYDRALKERDVVLAMAPSDPGLVISIAQITIAAGKLDDAINDTLPFVDQKTDYVWTSPQFAIGRAYFAKADYQKAAEFLEQSPQDPASSLPLLAGAYAELGEQAKAKAVLSKALAGNSQLTVSFMRFQFPNRDKEVVRRQDEALRKAGLPEA